MSCPRTGLVIFYEVPFINILRNSVSAEANIIAWIPVEELEKKADSYAQEIYSKLEGAIDIEIVSCLMIGQRPLKDMAKRFLRVLDIDGMRLLDVYKTYLSNFSRMRYQRIMERRRGGRLDGLVLGISHGEAGIVEDKLPGNVCNLCESSQDLYFNTKMLEHVLAEYPYEVKNLKYVVIDMFDYNYFNFDTIQTGAANIFLEESGFYYEERPNWNKSISVEELNNILEQRWSEGDEEEERARLTNIFPNLNEVDDSVYKGYMVLRERIKTISDAEIEEYRKEPKISAIQAKVFKETIDFQVKNFDCMIQKLKELNPAIQIYLLLLPKFHVVEEAEQGINRVWKQHFYQVVKAVQSKYTNVELWDWKGNTEFSTKKEYYFDLTHFNYAGACAFTEHLAEKLLSATEEDGLAERQEEAVNQLLDAIDMGAINEENIKNYSLFHLSALLEMTKEIENGQAFFLKIKSFLESLNLKRVRLQEKISVGLVTNNFSEELGEGLYQLFEKSAHFAPVLCDGDDTNADICIWFTPCAKETSLNALHVYILDESMINEPINQGMHQVAWKTFSRRLVAESIFGEIERAINNE